MNGRLIPEKDFSDIQGEYENWRKELESLIEKRKFNAVMGVNAEMLSLYWTIGHDILEKQKVLGGVRRLLIVFQPTFLAVFPMTGGIQCVI